MEAVQPWAVVSTLSGFVHQYLSTLFGFVQSSRVSSLSSSKPRRWGRE